MLAFLCPGTREAAFFHIATGRGPFESPCMFVFILPPALGRLLFHEVSPPTQRTVLECIVRTVRPSSTVSFEEPATGTVREQREVVSRGLISDTALVLGETLRSCSTHSFPESLPLGRRASEKLSHEFSPPTTARYSSVLGGHAPRERLRDSVEN